MKAAMLFYLKMVKNLKSKVFQMNPHDLGISNKTIEVDQMTHGWWMK